MEKKTFAEILFCYFIKLKQLCFLTTLYSFNYYMEIYSHIKCVSIPLVFLAEPILCDPILPSATPRDV